MKSKRMEPPEAKDPTDLSKWSLKTWCSHVTIPQLAAFVALLAGTFVAGMGLGARGNHVSPDKQEIPGRRFDHTNGVLDFFSEPMTVSFDIGYNYPERQSNQVSQAVAEVLWEAIFYGRQPPVFRDANDGKVVPIENPRSVSASGILIMQVRDKQNGFYDLVGHGHYVDKVSSNGRADGPTVEVTWGIEVRNEHSVPRIAFAEARPVSLVFDVIGAGRKKRFSGVVMLTSTGIKESRIDLIYSGEMDRIAIDTLLKRETEQTKRDVIEAIASGQMGMYLSVTPVAFIDHPQFSPILRPGKSSAAP